MQELVKARKRGKDILKGVDQGCWLVQAYGLIRM